MASQLFCDMHSHSYDDSRTEIFFVITRLYAILSCVVYCRRVRVAVLSLCVQLLVPLVVPELPCVCDQGT